MSKTLNYVVCYTLLTITGIVGYAVFLLLSPYLWTRYFVRAWQKVDSEVTAREVKKKLKEQD